MKYTVFFLLLLGPLFAFGQSDLGPDAERIKERLERVREARNQHLREFLDLTDAEAEAFLPRYDRFDQQRRELRRQMAGERRRPGGRRPGGPAAPADKGQLSEEEAAEALLRERRQRQELLRLQTAAEEAFLEVLPAAKVVRIEEAERAFRQKLLRRMRGMRGRN